MNDRDGLIITIEGKHDRGKTTTARLIEEYLKKDGYTNVRVEDPEPPLEDKDRFWERFQKTRERPVVIRVRNVEELPAVQDRCACKRWSIHSRDHAITTLDDGLRHTREACTPSEVGR